METLNDKAEGILLMSVDTAAANEIKDCASAHEMWTKQKNVRGTCEKLCGVTAASELSIIFKGKDESITAYWERASALYVTIKSADLKMDDSQFAMHIIRGLPREYEYLKRTAPLYKEDFDLAKFNRDLLHEEAKIVFDVKAESQPQGAFFSKTAETDQERTNQQKKSWAAYRDPRTQGKSSPRNPQTRAPTKTSGNCYRCNEKGHIGRDCPRYGDAANEKRRAEAEKRSRELKGKESQEVDKPKDKSAWLAIHNSYCSTSTTRTQHKHRMDSRNRCH